MKNRHLSHSSDKTVEKRGRDKERTASEKSPHAQGHAYYTQNCNDALGSKSMWNPSECTFSNAADCEGETHTPNANMTDHSVGARDELHDSEASEASVFCFDKFMLPLKNLALWTI